jgi:hypothetical protein
MSWMKLSTSLFEHPHLLRMSAKLIRTQPEFTLCSQSLLLGCLVRLWAYADTHINDSNHLPIGADQIDQIVGLPGFTALMPPEWLKIINPDRVELVRWLEHNGTSAKKRFQDAVRQSNHRARTAAGELDLPPRTKMKRTNTGRDSNTNESIDPSTGEIVTLNRDTTVTSHATLSQESREPFDQNRIEQSREDPIPPISPFPASATSDAEDRAALQQALASQNRDFRMADPELERWRDVPGVNQAALSAYFLWLATQASPPKVLPGHSRITVAQWLAGQGDAAAQQELCLTAQGANWKNLMMTHRTRAPAPTALIRRKTPAELIAEDQAQGLDPLRRLDQA